MPFDFIRMEADNVHRKKGGTFMFTNPGGKIKSYAKVLFWIGVVISVLIGVFVIGSSFTVAAYSYNGSFGTILGGIIFGLFIVAIGILISWISVLVLYAFGVLVENSDELVRLNGGTPSGNKKAPKIERPQHVQQTYVSAQPKTEEPVKQEAPAPQEKQEDVTELTEKPAAETTEAQVAEPTTDDTKKTCPNCGTEVAPDAHFCKTCGTKLD